MKTKQHVTLSLSKDVREALENSIDHGYKTMSDMVDAAVRQLLLSRNLVPTEKDELAALVDSLVDKRLRVAGTNLAAQIRNDVIEAVFARLASVNPRLLGELSPEEVEEEPEAADKEGWRA